MLFFSIPGDIRRAARRAATADVHAVDMRAAPGFAMPLRSHAPRLFLFIPRRYAAMFIATRASPNTPFTAAAVHGSTPASSFSSR